MSIKNDEHWYQRSCPAPDDQARVLAQARQQQLTKPAGSLGRLEEIALEFAAWQGCQKPHLKRVSIRVFAADHGVCAQNISAYPQEVTAQMVANIDAGGAAISVLSKELDSDLLIINMGVKQGLATMDKVVDVQLMSGTEDFSEVSAMNADVVAEAMKAGASQVEFGAQLCIGGEMGIGNTSSAAALLAYLLEKPARDLVGRGTGIDDAGMQHKVKVVEKALGIHSSHIDSPVTALQRLGGLEIAALVGYYIAAAQQGKPVLVDGFICTAAALTATRINPSCRSWMIFSHQSAEQGHQLALQALNAQPLLDLGMRLGEGSGAAVAVPLLRTALALHTGMATFTEAGVSEA